MRHLIQHVDDGLGLVSLCPVTIGCGLHLCVLVGIDDLHQVSYDNEKGISFDERILDDCSLSSVISPVLLNRRGLDVTDTECLRFAAGVLGVGGALAWSIVSKSFSCQEALPIRLGHCCIYLGPAQNLSRYATIETPSHLLQE